MSRIIPTRTWRARPTPRWLGTGRDVLPVRSAGRAHEAARDRARRTRSIQRTISALVRNAHDAIDLAAAVEHQEGRDAGDVEARGRRPALVDAELADPQPARHFDRDLLDHQRLHLA